MGLEDYLEVVWPRANVYLGSGPDDEKFLTRPYGRVDRPKLKRMLLQRCIDSGVIFHIDKVCLMSSPPGTPTVYQLDAGSCFLAIWLGCICCTVFSWCS